MMNVREAIAELDVDFDKIADPVARGIAMQLSNVVESQAVTIQELTEDNQKLKDEINRLKGEQGKPDVRKQTPPSPNVSSEKERKIPHGSRKKRDKKKGVVKISRVEKCALDKTGLPADAVFKGYQTVVVQDLAIHTDNVEFQKEVYYSPSLKKTFIAKTPAGYEGEYGPVIKALVLDLHHNGKMTESGIARFCETQGIRISQATIARMLSEKLEVFHQEKNDIVEAGLASSRYQQMDDTGGRVKGKNHYTHILCNALYTAYFTRRHKDRLTILDILSQGKMHFHFNESAYDLMEQMGLSKKRLNALRACNPAPIMTLEEVQALLKQLFPTPRNKSSNHPTSQLIILEGSAITAYQQLPDAIKILLADDAPQFKQITQYLALCWIHDGRHYKKLNPLIPFHRKQLDSFLTRYWDYYHQLLAYKTSPTTGLADSLREAFESLFATKTGYAQLDDRIEKTKLKQASLLRVLTYPELPLHNNVSELGARRQACYRDASYHTMSTAGTEAKDTFMTLIETAKKLSVNVYHYLYDRLTQKYEMPSLASLIKTGSQHHAFSSG